MTPSPIAAWKGQWPRPASPASKSGYSAGEGALRRKASQSPLSRSRKCESSESEVRWSAACRPSRPDRSHGGNSRRGGFVWCACLTHCPPRRGRVLAMQELLSTYVRVRGLDPLEVAGGVAFVDPSDPGHVLVRLLSVNAPRVIGRHLVTVRAEYAFEGVSSLSGRNWAGVNGGGFGGVDRPSEAGRETFDWPAIWPVARQREATILVNAFNATRVKVGSLTIPPTDPCEPIDERRAVRFDWTVPIGSDRDLDLIDSALDAARLAIASFLPPLARVVIEGYPASIALGGAPVLPGGRRR